MFISETCILRFRVIRKRGGYFLLVLRGFTTLLRMTEWIGKGVDRSCDLARGVSLVHHVLFTMRLPAFPSHLIFSLAERRFFEVGDKRKNSSPQLKRCLEYSATASRSGQSKRRRVSLTFQKDLWSLRSSFEGFLVFLRSGLIGPWRLVFLSFHLLNATFPRGRGGVTDLGKGRG